tara:strand:- start:28151 stop:28825 length:675 start_codon:yes stop_codon:yes gene_type:complete
MDNNSLTNREKEMEMKMEFKMRMMKKVVTSAVALMTLSISAAPQKKSVVLQFDHQQFKKQSVIKLKQEVKKVHPKMDLTKWNLKKVVLRAKSKRGKAEAFLKIGPSVSAVEAIEGNQFDFQSNRAYHPITFQTFGDNDKGVWQIHMKGNIKVKQAKLVLQKKVQDVTRKCSFQFETVWGKDIKRFSASATGPKGSGVQKQACQKARAKCNHFKKDIPLTMCTKL